MRFLNGLAIKRHPYSSTGSPPFCCSGPKETAIQNQQRELLDLIEEGKFGWEKVCELGQVLIGKHPGRTSDQQIIYYKSNTGVGIQFAAAGALIYEACKRQGLGKEIPTEWFGADLSGWMDKGYFPSP
ncbi:MAG: hypothetical protein HY694_11650 [Deltaproteobacteria bacterium]|nr:hypothetical protein [Deltaproteobacteria bacterium]